jgi:SAM-dependent MidA family methyltransferase
MRVEWRRAETSPPAGASGPGNVALVDSIRDEIAATGPITFARFMERALYDPAYGYYVTSPTRPTRTGDFLTAPELHPIFGATLARQIDEMWQRMDRPAPFVMREFGAGSGALFLAVADGLAAIGSPLAGAIRYEPVDFAAQRALAVERLTASGRAHQLVAITERGSLASGVVVANEFLDALPVHRVIQLHGELREIHIDWRDDRFTEIAGPSTEMRLSTWFRDRDIELAEGQRAEVNLAMLDWIRDVSASLQCGYVMAIDYGATPAALYGPDRPTGTIRAFAGQHVSADVLSGVGQRDITSHVDFDALERQAGARGLTVAGRRRSNEFLIACGLDDAYQQARTQSDTDWDAATNLRSAIRRLLDANALGGYLVSVLATDAPVDPPLRGFAEIARQR